MGRGARGRRRRRRAEPALLGAALLGTIVVAVVLASQARWAAAGVAGCGAGYFALRLFAGLGK